MSKQIRWGVLGPGAIAPKWLNGAKQVPNAVVTAIAGRTKANVDAIAEKYQIPNRFYSYEDLVKSDVVDICYVAVPHSFHKDIAILAMENKKSVLVEKPLAVSSKEVAEMISVAKKNNVFLMEAFWTRFFPISIQVQESLSRIGEIRAVTANFSFRENPSKTESRLFRPDLAGGGLLDVGVYVLTFADMIFQKKPVQTVGLASTQQIKVDDQAFIISKYDKGELASLGCGVLTEMEDTAYVYGTEGMIKVPIFWKPTKFEIVIKGKPPETIFREIPNFNENFTDDGFQFEIAHVNECLLKDLKESPIMTHEKSIQIIEQCDELRKQWGLVYPFET